MMCMIGGMISFSPVLLLLFSPAVHLYTMSLLQKIKDIEDEVIQTVFTT